MIQKVIRCLTRQTVKLFRWLTNHFDPKSAQTQTPTRTNRPLLLESVHFSGLGKTIRSVE